MNTPSWSDVSGSFSAVYTTSQNGYTYSIDTAGKIYYFNPYYFTWSLKSGPSNTPVKVISVGSDGSLGVVDNTGNSYLCTYGFWSNLYTPAMSIAVGDDQNFVIADQYGTVIESSYGATNYAYGPTKLSATAGLGKIWGVDSSGVVYQKTGGYYSVLYGKNLKQIDVSLSSSGAARVCGVDSSGNAWSLSGSNWTQISKPYGLASQVKFVSVEVGTGKIWATFSNGQIYCGMF